MFYMNSGIIYFTFFYVPCFVRCLVEDSAIEDNVLALTEAAIRQTFNNLFITFKIKDTSHNPKLKEFSITHNFFISITLTDGENLKKIAQLSQVYKLDNNTLHFMTQINEVSNEGDKRNEATDDKHVNRQILKFIENLRDLKDTYIFNRNFANYSVNGNILKYLNNSEITNVTNNDSDEIWKPTESSGRRIFRGHRTRIKHYPFVASVQFFQRFQCAGSIIEKDLVITAASCLQLAYNNRFFRENPAFLSVQVGSNFYEASGENIPVYEIYFHPEYTPNTLANNLAVMRLGLHIKFGKKFKKVRKVEYDRNPTPLSVNTNGIIIVGWGARDHTNVVYDPWVNKLSFAELNYYSLLECQKVYSKEYVTQKNFCAGFFSKAGGACQHDIGGPGLAAGILVGVISFGPPTCGTPDAPTVFTKVGFYADWIDDIIDMPVPVFGQKTTLRQSKVTVGPLYSRTTKHFHFGPMAIETDEVTNAHYDTPKKSLRILGDKKLFKEFLTTLFTKDDEYASGSNDESMEKETTKFIKRKGKTMLTTTSSTPLLPLLDQSEYEDEVEEEAEYETKMRTEPQSTKTEVSIDVDNSKPVKDISKLRTSESNEEYISEMKSKVKSTTLKSINVDVTTSEENSRVQKDISKITSSESNEENVSKLKSIYENSTIIKTNLSTEQVGSDDSKLEKDIMELLDDIDIRKLLESEEVVSNTEDTEGENSKESVQTASHSSDESSNLNNEGSDLTTE